MLLCVGFVLAATHSVHTFTANSYAISHLLGTVTTWLLDSDSVVTVGNYWQHSD